MGTVYFYHCILQISVILYISLSPKWYPAGNADGESNFEYARKIYHSPSTLQTPMLRICKKGLVCSKAWRLTSMVLACAQARLCHMGHHMAAWGEHRWRASCLTVTLCDQSHSLYQSSFGNLGRSHVSYLNPFQGPKTTDMNPRRRKSYLNHSIIHTMIWETSQQRSHYKHDSWRS